MTGRRQRRLLAGGILLLGVLLYYTVVAHDAHQKAGRLRELLEASSFFAGVPPDVDNVHSPGNSTTTTAARTRTTPIDVYYSQHGTLPPPRVTHSVLNVSKNNHDDNRKGIFVVGDVHGCLDELLLLHQTAQQQHNDGTPFAFVVLVGDLVLKGPNSLEVIRFVRQQPNWYAVRGNTDQRTLEAALQSPQKHLKKTKFQWIHTLSNADLMWLSELPYTITIPASLLRQLLDDDDDSSNATTNISDVLIVHAGLLPGVPLQDQTTQTMLQLRTVDPVYDGDSVRYEPHYFDTNTTTNDHSIPWSTVWQGPPFIIYGHDAPRGLVQKKWATGLDSGGVYGRKFSALVLPTHQLVQVDATRVHCPVNCCYCNTNSSITEEMKKDYVDTSQ